MEKNVAVDDHGGDDGQTLLHIAASKGQTAVVELLLERGANLSARSHDGGTVLHYVALGGRGRTTCLETLLRKGLDVNVTDDEGETPLHWGLDTGLMQAKVLLLHGADMDATNNQGESVLQMAKTYEERHVSGWKPREVSRGSGLTRIWWPSEASRLTT
jgi:ankyrin repeat protein